jgi:glycosyltransferase involved in cell wall biosynthesis
MNAPSAGALVQLLHAMVAGMDTWSEPAVRDAFSKMVDALSRRNDIAREDVHRIASLCKRLGCTAEARDWFNRIDDERDVRQLVGAKHFHLGELCLKDEDQRQAVGHFKQCLAYIPDHGSARSYLDTLAPTASARTDPSEPSEVTVAICLHNRAHHLPELLNALNAQEGAPPFELLCVMNQPPQPIRAVIESTVDLFAGRVRLVEEPELGLSHARNRAVAECTTRWLAFLDDDAIPGDAWLGSLVNETTRMQARVAGGRTILRWSAPRPDWCLPHFDCWFSCVDLGPDTRFIAESEYVGGGNMLYDMSVFAQGLAFDPALGRRGDDLLSNEELALQSALRAVGIRSLYVGAATVEHIVDPKRITPEWLAERVFAQGRSACIHDSLQCDNESQRRELEMHSADFWQFVSNYRNYRPENWPLWITTFARDAGYLWAHAATGRPQMATDGRG